MSFDGMIERNNIFAKLKPLAGGRVHRGIPAAIQVEKFADGNIRPYIATIFGSPIPTTGDRGMGVGDRGQPHIMPITIGCFAANAYDAEKLSAAVMNLLLDFSPNGNNATEMKAAGGYNYTTEDGAGVSIRFEHASHWTTIINLSNA